MCSRSVVNPCSSLVVDKPYFEEPSQNRKTVFANQQLKETLVFAFELEAVGEELPLIAWLLRRLRYRFNHLSSEAEVQSLSNRYQNYSVSGFVHFVDTHQGLRAKKSAEQRLVQELLFLYNAMPCPEEKLNNIPVNLWLDASSLLNMAAARENFAQQQPRLLEHQNRFWQQQALQASEVLIFNERFGPTQNTVAITLLSRRWHCGFKRLTELTLAAEQIGLELVVVVADPENVDSSQWSALQKALQTCPFRCTLVYSAKNTIANNRNLSICFSRAEFITFLDDDVEIHGPVLQNIASALSQYPELGMVSVPAYDHELLAFKPRSNNLVFPYKENIFLTNMCSGMIMGTRRELMQVMPFAPFWPNYGEDNFLGYQLHAHGFFNAYVMPEDAYVVHEDVNYRATKSPQTGLNVLISECLMYLISRASNTVSSGRASTSIQRIRHYLQLHQYTCLELTEFFHEFCEAIAVFIKEGNQCFEVLIKKNSPLLHAVDSHQLQVFFHQNCAAIASYIDGLSPVYPTEKTVQPDFFLGPLRFQWQASGN